MKPLVSISGFFRQRRVWRGLFVWFLLPLAGLYLLSNIALNSQWMRARVTKALELRSGVSWELETLNWTPNGHLHVRGLRAELGDGELSVDHVRMVPNWAQVRQKKLGFSSITVERPLLDVSHEWLLEQASGVEFESSKEDEASSPQPELADLGNDGSLDSADPSKAPSSEKGVAGGSAPLPSTGVKPAKSVTAKQDKAFYEFDAWLKVVDGSVKIRRAGGELVGLEGIRASIPYGGVDLEGEIFCERASLIGRTLLNEAEVKLHKKGPVLGLKETDLQFLGVEMEPKFYLVRGAQGVYFFSDLHLPKQHVNLVLNHLELSVGLTVEDLQARMQFAGIVTRPIDWRGGAAIQSKSLNVTEGHRGSLLHFDKTFAEAALFKGALRMPRAEMTGEDISVMSNGVVAMNGRGFGVVRLVASPEKKGWIDKFSQGCGIFSEARSRIMRPLNSGDLYFVDAHLDGPVFQPMVKLDQVTDWEPLWDEVGKVMQFIRNERAEELISPEN